MNRMKVVTELRIYEHDGNILGKEKDFILKVESDPIDSNRAILSVPNGSKITIVCTDLMAALKNAMNAA